MRKGGVSFGHQTRSALTRSAKCVQIAFLFLFEFVVFAALYGLVKAARNACRRVHALVVGSVHAVSSPGVHRTFGLIAFPSFGCWRTQSGAQIHDASLFGRFPGIAMFDAQWQSGYLDKSSCAMVLPFACLRVSRGAKLVNTASPHIFR